MTIKILFIYLLNNSSDVNSKTQSNILDNYLFFKKELLKKIKEENISIREIISLFSKIEYVSIQINNEEDKNFKDDPQIIFERINSTGVELTLGDLIKNFLLMRQSDQERLYDDYWSKIEEKIGVDNLKNYICHYIIYKSSHYVDQKKTKKSYDFFKKQFKKNNWKKRRDIKGFVRTIWYLFNYSSKKKR